MQKLTQIQSIIQQTTQDYEKLVKLKMHIAEIDKKLSDSYSKLKVMDKELDAELKDIESLEKVGVKSLFYKTLGSKEEQLEKERQEYLDLSLHFNELKKEVELMEYEREILAKKVLKLPSLKKKLAALKIERKNEILSGGESSVKSELLAVLHKIDTHIKLEIELEEAIAAGQKCLKYLDSILNHLSQASDWGRWDIRGDDRRAGYMRKRAIDNAIKQLPYAQHQLNFFVKEMNDLGEDNIAINLQDVHFARFKDFFFDNLISDWIIQQKIKNTYHNIESTRSHIKRVISSLTLEKNNLDQRVNKLEKQKEELILA